MPLFKRSGSVSSGSSVSSSSSSKSKGMKPAELVSGFSSSAPNSRLLVIATDPAPPLVRSISSTSDRQGDSAAASPHTPKLDMRQPSPVESDSEEEQDQSESEDSESAESESEEEEDAAPKPTREAKPVTKGPAKSAHGHKLHVRLAEEARNSKPLHRQAKGKPLSSLTYDDVKVTPEELSVDIKETWRALYVPCRLLCWTPQLTRIQSPISQL